MVGRLVQAHTAELGLKCVNGNVCIFSRERAFHVQVRRHVRVLSDHSLFSIGIKASICLNVKPKIRIGPICALLCFGST